MHSNFALLILHYLPLTGNSSGNMTPLVLNNYNTSVKHGKARIEKNRKKIRKFPDFSEDLITRNITQFRLSWSASLLGHIFLPFSKIFPSCFYSFAPPLAYIFSRYHQLIFFIKERNTDTSFYFSKLVKNWF
jgi:hypothetical protein